MTTGGAQSNWKIGDKAIRRGGEEAGETPERGTIASLVALAVLVGGEGTISSYSLRSRNLINLFAKDQDYMVLRNGLPPLLRRNRLATKNSLCSLRLPPFLLSPLAHEARGDPKLRYSCAESSLQGL